MIVFDSVVLTLILNEHSDVPNDPATGAEIEHARERIDFLVEQLAKAREQILIPTPVLAEVLVVAGSAGVRYVRELQASSVFRIADFDSLAAIELGEITKAALLGGDKKSGADAPWQRIKLDRQIIAIAKCAGARRIYTNDKNMSSFASMAGIEAVPIQDMPLRPTEPQLAMELVPPGIPIKDDPEEFEIDLDGDVDGDEEQAPEI